MKAFLLNTLITRIILLTAMPVCIGIGISTFLIYEQQLADHQQQTIEQLREYIVERGRRESEMFLLTEKHLRSFRDEYLLELSRSKEMSEDSFEQLFETHNDSVTRVRRQFFDGAYLDSVGWLKGIDGVIFPGAPLTKALKQRIWAGLILLVRQGPFLRNLFTNLYIFLPEKIGLDYWPEIAWTFNADLHADFSAQEWFYMADPVHNPARQTIWTGLYHDAPAGAWMVSCQVPIDLDGRHIATVGTDILLENLLKNLIYDHPQNVYNLIFRADGRLIADPYHLDELKAANGQYNILKENDQRLHDIFIATTRYGETNVVIDDRASDQLLAVTRIQGPDWYFVSVYPRSVMKASAAVSAHRMLIFGSACGLLIFALLNIFLRWLVAKPLARLQKQAAAIVENGGKDIGTLMATLSIHRGDEVGRLAKTFSQMADQVQAYTRDLEGLVTKRTQQLAKEKEAARKYLDVVGVMIVVINVDELVALINRRGCEILEYAPENVIGLNWFTNFMPTNAIAESRQIFQQLMSGQRRSAELLEGPILTHTGRKRIIAWSNAALRDEKETVYAIIASGEDVTEQRSAERALRESERRLSLVLEGAGLGLWDWNIRTGELIFNEYWTQSLGYRLNELEPHMHTWERLVHPEDIPRAIKAFKSHLEKQTDFYETEFRIKTKSGEWRWFLSRGKVMERDSAGRPLRATGTHMDITERKQVEAQLRQAAVVFENTTEGVIVTDLDGKIFAANRAFTEITGYQEAEVQSRGLDVLFSAHHDATFYAALWQEARQQGVWQGELWNQRKDGDIYPGWLNISAVRDTGGDTTGYVIVLSDITKIKQAEAELHRLAHHDALTGLPNRMLFYERLRYALQRAERNNGCVGILFLDLDRFKNINDSLGHHVGDDLLRFVSVRLSERLRKSDTIARHGGDEFTILLEEINGSKDAASVARDILDCFSEPAQLAQGHQIFVNTSIGISLYPQDGREAMELIKNADAAMYQAKEQGKGRYCFYTAEITRAISARLMLETRLRHAVATQAFYLVYQPQYDLKTGRIIGVEALIRWHDSELGDVPPNQFIPLAEETGLIASIGAWVLQSACVQARHWHDAGNRDLVMAVNISARQLAAGNLIEQVRTVLQQTGLAPDCLELELTESVLMEQGEKGFVALEAVTRLGVTLAVDDFGTGYSSLAYLKRLAVDKIKIDRSFIRDVPADMDDMEIVSTIIAMARNLKLKVVAEGVENRQQEAFLKARGCNQVQGFLYCGPVAPEALFEKTDFKEVVHQNT